MPTDNHDLNTPAEGSTDWHIPINDNFRAIEVDLVVWDTGGNRGSYTAHNGATFIATDTGNVYRGDGTDWGSAVLTIGGGSGTGVEIQNGGTSLTTNATLIDVLDGLEATSPSSNAVDLAIATGGVDTTELAAQAVTPTEVDGSGGGSGDVLQTDGTASGVSWAAGGGGSYSDEDARDALGTALTGGTDISVTPDDPGDEITVSYTGGAGTQKLTDTGINNLDGGDIYELPQDIDSILAQFQMELVSQNLHARDDRPLFTTDDRTVFVDPSTGSDTNDGTSGAPLKTLTEAMRRVPIIVQHDYIIDLADDTYANVDEGNQILGPPMILSGWQGPNTSSNFKIRGNQTDPQNVIVESGIGIGIISAEEDDTGADAVISGLTLRGDINCKAGKGLTVDNVRFTGTPVAANHAIQGKGDFSVTLRNCEFDTNRGYVAHVGEHGAEVMMRGGNTGTVSEYTYWLGGGATGRFQTDGDQIGQKGQYQIDNGASVFDRHGQPRGRDVQLTDDWDDGRFASARIANAGPQHRPEWSDAGTNSPSVTSDGKLLMPADSKVNGPVHPNLPSEVTFDYQWQDTGPTSGSLQLRWGWDFAEYWQVLINNDTTVKLQKRISAVTSDVITGTGTDDTAEHEITVTRSEADAYDLLEDDTSLGTATDSDYPSRGNAWEVEIRNETDAGVTLDNLFMGTWPA